MSASWEHRTGSYAPVCDDMVASTNYMYVLLPFMLRLYLSHVTWSVRLFEVATAPSTSPYRITKAEKSRMVKYNAKTRANGGLH